MVKEAVLCGSDGCLLWPASTIQSMASLWHDVPVCVDHPMANGTPVSIKTCPHRIIGHVKNPVFDPATKSLKATIKVPQHIQGIHQIQQLREVSIGVFTNNLQDNGHYQGKRYIGRVTTARPDHLAILDGVGACDWSSGCGIRVHSEIEELRALAGQAITNLVNDILGRKGDGIMRNYPDQAHYPAEVYEASKEADELAILASWEKCSPNMITPLEVLELQAKHAPKRESQGSGHQTFAMYPPGVE